MVAVEILGHRFEVDEGDWRSATAPPELVAAVQTLMRPPDGADYVPDLDVFYARQAVEKAGGRIIEASEEPDAGDTAY